MYLQNLYYDKFKITNYKRLLMRKIILHCMAISLLIGTSSTYSDGLAKKTLQSIASNPGWTGVVTCSALALLSLYYESYCDYSSYCDSSASLSLRTTNHADSQRQQNELEKKKDMIKKCMEPTMLLVAGTGVVYSIGWGISKLAAYLLKTGRIS